MFTGKIFDRPKKAKRKHSIAYYIIGSFTLAIELMLGVNAAFLINQSMVIVSHSMLDGTPLAGLSDVIALVISLAVGASFILAGIWLFGGFITSLDRAKAFAFARGASWPWPQGSIWLLLSGVMLLDYLTLAYRRSYFVGRGQESLFAFFCVLIPLPWLLGLVLHVLENTPGKRRLAEVRNFALDLQVDDIAEAVQYMDAGKRTRLLDGDMDALQEYYQEVEADRQASYDYEQQQIAARKQRQVDSQQSF